MGKKISDLIVLSIQEIVIEWELEPAKYLSDQTVVWGEGSKFSSIHLVNILIRIEEKLDSDFNIRISIADERAISQKHSPFRTIGSLTEFILSRIEEVKDRCH